MCKPYEIAGGEPGGSGCCRVILNDDGGDGRLVVCFARSSTRRNCRTLDWIFTRPPFCAPTVGSKIRGWAGSGTSRPGRIASGARSRLAGGGGKRAAARAVRS